MKDSELDQKLKEASERSAAAIAGSAAFVAIFNKSGLSDPVYLLQMGLAVYMDKPIYLLVPQDAVIPENLRRLARKIEYFWRNPDDMSSIRAATEKLLSDLRESGNNS